MRLPVYSPRASLGTPIRNSSRSSRFSPRAEAQQRANESSAIRAPSIRECERERELHSSSALSRTRVRSSRSRGEVGGSNGGSRTSRDLEEDATQASNFPETGVSISSQNLNARESAEVNSVITFRGGNAMTNISEQRRHSLTPHVLHTRSSRTVSTRSRFYPHSASVRIPRRCKEGTPPKHGNFNPKRAVSRRGSLETETLLQRRSGSRNQIPFNSPTEHVNSPRSKSPSRSRLRDNHNHSQRRCRTVPPSEVSSHPNSHIGSTKPAVLCPASSVKLPTSNVAHPAPLSTNLAIGMRATSRERDAEGRRARGQRRRSSRRSSVGASHNSSSKSSSRSRESPDTNYESSSPEGSANSWKASHPSFSNSRRVTNARPVRNDSRAPRSSARPSRPLRTSGGFTAESVPSRYRADAIVNFPESPVFRGASREENLKNSPRLHKRRSLSSSLSSNVTSRSSKSSPNFPQNSRAFGVNSPSEPTFLGSAVTSASDQIEYIRTGAFAMYNQFESLLQISGLSKEPARGLSTGSPTSASSPSHVSNNSQNSAQRVMTRRTMIPSPPHPKSRSGTSTQNSANVLRLAAPASPSECLLSQRGRSTGFSSAPRSHIPDSDTFSSSGATSTASDDVSSHTKSVDVDNRSVDERADQATNINFNAPMLYEERASFMLVNDSWFSLAGTVPYCAVVLFELTAVVSLNLLIFVSINIDECFTVDVRVLSFVALAEQFVVLCYPYCGFLHILHCAREMILPFEVYSRQFVVHSMIVSCHTPQRHVPGTRLINLVGKQFVIFFDRHQLLRLSRNVSSVFMSAVFNVEYRM